MSAYQSFERGREILERNKEKDGERGRFEIGIDRAGQRTQET